jgi:hypothetical protein
MKVKTLLKFTALALAAIPLTANADQPTPNYLESFSASSFNLSSYAEWGRLQDPGMTKSYTSSDGKVGKAIGFSGYQNSSDSATPGETATIYYDLLVSPPVKGNVQFYWKRAVYNASFKTTIKAYAVTKNDDGTYVMGKELADFSETTLATTGTSWQADPLTLSLADYTRVGLRLEYCYIDEFSADYAMMPDKLELTFTSAVLTEEANQRINLADDQKVTVHPVIVFTNTGNLVYPAGSTFTIKPSFTGGEEVEYTIPNDIAVGETYTFDTPLEYTVPEPTGSSVYTSLSLDVKFGEETQTTSYVLCYPNRFTPEVRYNSGTTEKPSWKLQESNKTYEFDTFQGARSCEVKFKNLGAAPMIISSVSLPDGVAVSKLVGDNLPYTLNCEEEIVETVTVTGDVAGAFDGKVELVFANDERKLLPESNVNVSAAFNLKGYVVPAGVYFANFEDNKVPDGWYLPNGSQWSVTSNDISSTYNKYVLANAKQSPLSSIQTCKLHFAEGETLHFIAAKQTQYGGELQVQYSTDRFNWTDVAHLYYGTTGDFPSSAKVWQEYNYTMPEGDYFLNFLSGYIYLDNIYGGTPVENPYDIAPTTYTVGDMPMVNHSVDLTFNFDNIGGDIAADAYSLRLIDNGKVKDLENIGDLESGASFTVSASLTPHSADENYPATLMLVDSNDEEVAKFAVTFAVEEETAATKNIIGKATNSNAYIPFRANLKYSIGEFVLPRTITVTDKSQDPAVETEVAAPLSLLADNKITSFIFKTYNDRGAESFNIKVYVEDTDDAEVGIAFTDPTTMTLVYENEAHAVPKEGSSTDLRDFVVPFKEPFIHDPSKNLRVYVSTVKAGSNWMAMWHEPNSQFVVKCLYYGNSSAEWTTGKESSATDLPAMIIVTEHDALSLDGKVTQIVDKEETPVAGADITAYNEENDVIYNTVSDEDGSYSLPIIQVDKEYVVSATHPSATNAEGEAFIQVLESYSYDSESNDFTFILDSDGIHSVSVSFDPTAAVEFFNLQGVRVASDNLTPGIYIRRTGRVVEKVLVK